jgi:uncharacterized membrane protein
METFEQAGVAREHRTEGGTAGDDDAKPRVAVGASRPPWLVTIGLIALSLVPLAAGAARLSQLARGVPANADNARFVATPLPVVLHVVGATLFCVLGALQFAPTLREQRWHRLAGRVVLPAGLVAALSGLWMAFVYALPAGEDDAALKVLRLVFGVGMVAALVRGSLAIRRRDFAAHRAWMMRGYAIGLGAGTQALMMVPWWLLVGKPIAPTRTLLMGAGWIINLIVAERLISTRRRASTSKKALVGKTFTIPVAFVRQRPQQFGQKPCAMPREARGE